MNLTKAGLVDCLCVKFDLSKHEAKEIVENFFAIIAQNLIEGHEVKISKFGNFSIQIKKSRPGRNPKTGENALISSRKVIRFKQSGKLKQFINVEQEH